MNAKDIQRRAELKRFKKLDLETLMAKLEREELHRMQAREIHWKILCLRSASSIIDIRGR